MGVGAVAHGVSLDGGEKGGPLALSLDLVAEWEVEPGEAGVSGGAFEGTQYSGHDLA